jgi:hypothetical protein
VLQPLSKSTLSAATENMDLCLRTNFMNDTPE